VVKSFGYDERDGPPEEDEEEEERGYVDEPSEICGKEIYIVENHARALEAWAEIRRAVDEPPILVTIDHHSDTNPAFNKAIWEDGLGPENGLGEVSRTYALALDYRNAESLSQAIARLRHDEHIHAAILAEIINHAYVISFQGSSITHPKRSPSLNEYSAFQEKFPSRDLTECPYSKYDMPWNRIFELKPKDGPYCVPEEDGYHECLQMYYSDAIETSFLLEQFASIDEMSKVSNIADVTSEKFILDIDLDYFHSKRAIRPLNSTYFHQLIRKSLAITIATEPNCVMSNRLRGETITSEELKDDLLGHIRDALDSPMYKHMKN
jgi:hypothetical protein